MAETPAMNVPEGEGTAEIEAVAPDTTVSTIISRQTGLGDDVSGFGQLTRQFDMPGQVTGSLDGWFGLVVQTVASHLPDAVEACFVDRDELTLRVRPAQLAALAKVMRDDPYLRFEVCVSVSGVHYPLQLGGELHVVYHLLSVTHNRRLRLEVAVPVIDPRVASVTPTWPMANYHERETYDMFGVIFEGHPALTRILMPDDYVGYPQRKDFPLGGVPLQFKGASTAPVEQRREYRQ